MHYFYSKYWFDLLLVKLSSLYEISTIFFLFFSTSTSVILSCFVTFISFFYLCLFFFLLNCQYLASLNGTFLSQSCSSNLILSTPPYNSVPILSIPCCHVILLSNLILFYSILSVITSVTPTDHICTYTYIYSKKHDVC